MCTSLPEICFRYHHDKLYFCNYCITFTNISTAVILRTVPTNKEVFLCVYDYAWKTDLSKGY